MRVLFQTMRRWRGVGSQRGGRGKERGFSFGVVDVVVDEDIFVMFGIVLEILDMFGCMYY
jgi:hypothetical protein